LRTQGKVAVVAGGGSGLGRAVCVELAARGAAVAVLDRNGFHARETAAALPNALAIEVDVTDAQSVQRAIDTTRDEFGSVHINVNTAGVATAAKIVSRGVPADFAAFQRVIDINLNGTFNVMRVAVAAMLENESDDGERGVVVNTASGAAFDGQVGQAAYSASKAGVVAMALPIVRDLAGTGVRVNTIAPGLFDTPMAAGLPDRVRAGLIATVQEPARLGRPEEFADLVCSIVGNPYLNGECIRLDGGTRLPPR
jgi:NAD(P)-dependent dehydrogenase (short-subunit alcohol dehydrogenase family)